MSYADIGKKIFEKGYQFRKTFGVPVNQFLDFSGFDIIKFDEWLNTPKGVSTKNFITKKYGKEASELINSLL
jgi:hypothetical protein